MKFGQQKFLIILLLAVLPLLSIFSVLESPFLSHSLLKFSLRFVNFRTGVPVSAKAWNLHPTTFSASILDVDFSYRGMLFRANEIEAQLSPVDLVLGIVKFRNITIRGITLRGTVPPAWLVSNSNDPTPDLQELPILAAKKLEDINALLAKNKLGVGELELENAQLDFSNLKIKDLDLRFTNQSRGQARVDVSTSSFTMPKKIALSPGFSASLSLSREAKDRPVFLVRNLQLNDFSSNKPALVLSGRLPGQMSARLDLDLKALNLFLSKGTLTKSLVQRNLSGQVEGSLGFLFEGSKNWKLTVEDLNIHKFTYDDYRLDRINLSFDYASKNEFELRKALLTLPSSLSDPRQWKQNLEITSLKFKNQNQIEGTLQAREMSLCSIMIATAVDECYASFQINGPATFEGILDPLKINLKTDWSLSEAKVFSDPEVPGRKGSSPLLLTKPAKLAASAVIFEKYLALLDSSITWGTSAKIGVKGDIKYIPTKVELDLKADHIELSEVLASFMDQPVAGISAIKSQILYDYSAHTRPERTKVFGSLEISKFAYAGQMIGQLNAPLLYEKGDLNIGPASLASGGGTALLRGVLQNRPDNKSRLEASATLRRYELAINGRESNKSIVRGFYTGVIKLDGYLSETSTQTGIRGRISGALDSAQVLGISLNRIEGILSLKGSDLVLNELRGEKNKRTISASGLVAARPGESYVDFEAKDIDVVGLGWDPKIEGLFSTGRLSMSGRWAEKDGYKIKGNLTNLADPTYAYGDGSFNASGDDAHMRFDVGLNNGFSMAMRGTYHANVLNYDAVEAKLKDQGIFLALSYLNAWKEKVDLVTTGSIELGYGTSSGNVSVGDLKLRRHDSGGRMLDVLNVEGKHTLVWNKEAIRGEAFSSTGEATLTVKPLGDSLQINGKWSSDLLDILLPDFLRLRDGYAQGSLLVGFPLSVDKVKGTFQLEGVSVGINGLGRYGQNTTGSVEIRDSRILFQKVHSSFGGGYADVNGEYKFDTNNPGVYVNVDLSNAEFVFINQVPAVTSGAVILSGNSYPFDVRGRVAISDGLYSAETSKKSAPAESTAQPLLKFDIGVDVGSKFSVRNALISTNAVGAMRLVGTDVRPSFVGVVQLENGRVFARDNEFKIVRGVVDFPVNSDNVFINVTATTDIKTSKETYTITLNATGTTSEPNIEFQSNPPLALGDIASLLAFGVTRSDETADSSGSLADTARAEALQTIFGKTIGSSLRQRTGLDVRVSATADIAAAQTIPKVTVMRKLSKNVTATFGRSLDFSRPENNMQIDYELLKNVNVSGVWENPNPKESSLGFDLRFKWDVK